MTLAQAERIIGAPVSITEKTDMRLIFATAYVKGYPQSAENLVVGKGRSVTSAVWDLCDKHYEWMRKTIYKEQNGRCNFCGGSLTGGMEMDHIEMRSHGRSDVRTNLRLLDSACHQRRHRPKAISASSISGQADEV